MNTTRQNTNKFFPFILASFLLLTMALSDLSAVWQGDLTRVIPLEGQWKFSIGERYEWLASDYDHNDWQSIQVPSSWENQGFHGYNGFATYRKSFTLPSNLKEESLYLILGYIDDVDETYINGHKIGSSGSFPPQYTTAYNAKRIYSIPNEILNFGGTNNISIVVYDAYNEGGIVSGRIGIYKNPNAIPVEINLQGEWKFNTGDNIEWAEYNFNDQGWSTILVPSKWEDQGYRNYDGYAWYRKTFTYNKALMDDKLILVLGRIDDVDEVYINGIKIGSTGNFDKNGYVNKYVSNSEFKAMRGYYFDASLLKKNQKNTITVRVYDPRGVGGIYEGQIGLITQKKYIQFWRERKQRIR